MSRLIQQIKTLLSQLLKLWQQWVNTRKVLATSSSPDWTPRPELIPCCRVLLLLAEVLIVLSLFAGTQEETSSLSVL